MDTENHILKENYEIPLVSVEIGNSLAMISSLINQLQTNETSSEDIKRIRILQHEAALSRNLLLKLMLYYRYQHQQSAPDLSGVNVYDMTDDILLIYQDLIECMNIKINNQIPQDLYWTLDKVLLSAAIANILIYFCTEADNEISISVQDNGPYHTFMIAGDKAPLHESLFIPKELQLAEIDIALLVDGVEPYFIYWLLNKHVEGQRLGHLTTDNLGMNHSARFCLHLPC